ncbi:MAG: hypothetical protein A6F72_05030 [Cycloclasticus sp. symbiont of Poecilosclerida sp. N]|nr:MAG: hypothetical protein A6F72_05030 [Cycloclasticus sp. symbiont of Poecilosclerida sp. N]
MYKRFLAATAVFLLMSSWSVAASSLQEMIGEAVKSHPLVELRQAELSSYASGVETARWQFFPTPLISMEAVDADESDRSYQGDDYVATVRLTQPLWSGGRLTAGLSKAEAREAVGYATLEETRKEIAIRVVQQYGSWLSASLRRQARQTSLSTHESLLERVRSRVKEGVSSSSDLALAQGRLASAKADVSVALAQERIALSQLSQLTGRTVSKVDLDVNQPSPRGLSSNIDMDSMKIDALAVSPSIVRAQAELLTADAELKEIKADKWPELYLRAEYQEGNLVYEGTGSEARMYVGFNTRFGAGLSNFSRVKESRHRREAALARVQSQRLEVTDQVASDYALMLSFESRILSLESSLEAARLVSESYGYQFLVGRKTWLDVMNAARDLVVAQVQLADTQASRLTVLWRLFVTVRGLPQVLSDDVEGV